MRDAEGNVIDIIIDQEPEFADQPSVNKGEDRMEMDDEDEEEGQRRVEGKTDVVRCESRFYTLSP